MEGSVKERLISYLRYKGVSYSEFGRTIGVSNAYVTSIRKSIQPDKVQSIALNYQDLNIDWLLTGEGEMLKPSAGPTSEAPRSKIPLYGAYSVGGTSVAAPSDAITAPTEWIDAGDWFRDATATMHHYGDSMLEYPSGSILVIREIKDKSLIIWGKNYVIETDEYRVTKRLQRSSNPDYIVATVQMRTPTLMARSYISL